MGGITVTRIADAGGLSAAAGEWNALVGRAAGATPFHRPEWLIPWWERFGSGDLHALAFRAGGRLVGMLAAFVHPWQGRRQVTLVGNGITDYLGLIAEPVYTDECARLTLEYFDAISDEWDVSDWQDLMPGSALLRHAPRAMACSTIAAMACTRAELPPDADEYESSLPHGLRRNIRVATRRLERQGELRFETVRSGAAAYLPELFRLHEDRWKTRGGAESMLDRPDTQQFLVEATRRFGERGSARIYAMRYGGELTAIIFALLDLGSAWGYICGMNPELSRFSPGSLVLRHAMREAIGEGARAWEFLRGDEEYKFLWGAQIVPKTRLMAWPRAESMPA